MSSVEEDIKDLLEIAPTLDLTFPTNLFIGILPDKPIIATAIRTAPGRPSQDNNEIQYDYYILEVVSRGVNYNTVSQLMQDIKTYLTSLCGTTVGEARYVVLRAITPPYLYEYSENNQPVFSMMIEIQRQIAN